MKFHYIFFLWQLTTFVPFLAVNEVNNESEITAEFFATPFYALCVWKIAAEKLKVGWNKEGNFWDILKKLNKINFQINKKVFLKKGLKLFADSKKLISCEKKAFCRKVKFF